MAWISFFVALLALVWVLLLVLRRRREHREAEEERAMAFMLAHGGAEAYVRPALDDLPSDDEAAPETVIGEIPPDEPARGRPYLDRAQAAAFIRLRRAFPDHEVFPRASLRRAAGLERIDKDALLDFVVCTRELVPVAAIDLMRGAPPMAEAQKRTLLTEAGVRYARWPVDAMPPPEELARWFE